MNHSLSGIAPQHSGRSKTNGENHPGKRRTVAFKRIAKACDGSPSKSDRPDWTLTAGHKERDREVRDDTPLRPFSHLWLI